MYRITNEEREKINYSEVLFKQMLLNCSKGERYKIRLVADAGEKREIIEKRTFNEFEELFKYITLSEDTIGKINKANCKKYWWEILKVICKGDMEIPVMKCTMTKGGRIITRMIDKTFLLFCNDQEHKNAYKLYQSLCNQSVEISGRAKVDKCKFFIGDIICMESTDSQDPVYAVYIGELSKGKYRCIAKKATDLPLDFIVDYTLEELDCFEKISESPYEGLEQIRELILQEPFYYYKWLLYFPTYKAYYSEESFGMEYMLELVAADMKKYNSGKGYFR